MQTNYFFSAGLPEVVLTLLFGAGFEVEGVAFAGVAAGALPEGIVFVSATSDLVTPFFFAGV